MARRPVGPQNPKAVAARQQTVYARLMGGKMPAEPEPVYALAKVRFSTLPDIFSLQETVDPIVLNPPAAKKAAAEVSQDKKEKKGFFVRLKGFFASIFHR